MGEYIPCTLWNVPSRLERICLLSRDVSSWQRRFPVTQNKDSLVLISQILHVMLLCCYEHGALQLMTILSYFNRSYYISSYISTSKFQTFFISDGTFNEWPIVKLNPSETKGTAVATSKNRGLLSLSLSWFPMGLGKIPKWGMSWNWISLMLTENQRLFSLHPHFDHMSIFKKYIAGLKICRWNYVPKASWRHLLLQMTEPWKLYGVGFDKCCCAWDGDCLRPGHAYGMWLFP